MNILLIILAIAIIAPICVITGIFTFLGIIKVLEKIFDKFE